LNKEKKTKKELNRGKESVRHNRKEKKKKAGRRRL
jgi:hypothetical protein